MSIKIDRFEPKKLSQNTTFTAEKDKAVVIKDHSNDRIIGLVNLERTLDSNMELARVIIEAIESWIENENQH